MFSVIGEDLDRQVLLYIIHFIYIYIYVSIMYIDM